jgi:hypothetical protein
MFNLSVRLRNRLNSALKAKSWKKTNKLSEYLGCTLSELVVYIESKFTEGMSWDNRNEWHIEHIVCLSSASTPEELHKLCHYTNLQPLWAEDNIRKADSIG